MAPRVPPVRRARPVPKAVELVTCQVNSKKANVKGRTVTEPTSVCTTRVVTGVVTFKQAGVDVP